MTLQERISFCLACYARDFYRERVRQLEAENRRVRAERDEALRLDRTSAPDQ